MLGVISVRKKEHSEQMMKVHMIKYYSISNSFNCDWWQEEKQFGWNGQKNHDNNYHKKTCDVSSVTCASKYPIQNFKWQAISNIINLISYNGNINQIKLWLSLVWLMFKKAN